VLRVAFAVCTVALVAAAAGYVTLGVVVGAGLVGSAYLALVCYAAVRVADGLIAVGVRLPPLDALAMVRHHRALVERRILGVLHLVAISVWAMMTLRYLGLRGRAIDLAHTIVSAEVQRGNVSVSVGDVLVFGLTIVGTFLLSRLLRFVLEEEIYPRVASGGGTRYALSALLHYGLVVVGVMLALATLGVDLTKITILAGALGVGIGFGLQNIVNNIVSGFILFVERRIDVGDAVQIADVGGRVQHMGLRACTVRTWEGAEVIVPNASLVSDRVTNWTLSDRHRRIDVAVRVAYGTAPETVAALLLAVARADKRVLLEPVPLALFRGFGESGLRFELQVWTDRFDTWVRTQSELTMAVHDALRDAGIELPLPQREVRLRSTHDTSGGTTRQRRSEEQRKSVLED
jgi:small-conductance mechanosensitive channel